MAPPGARDIDSDRAELQARGVKISEIKQEPWGRYEMFKDPDGNGFVLREGPA